MIDRKSSIILPLDKIRSFCGVNKKHYRFILLAECFRSIPAAREPIAALARVLERDPLGREDVEEFFARLGRLCADCGRGELAIAGDRIRMELQRQPEIASVEDDTVHLAAGLPEDLRHQFVSGVGEAAFLLRVLRTIRARLAAAQVTDAIFATLDDRLSGLLALSDEGRHPDLESRRELRSDLVLKDSWSLLRDMDRVIREGLSPEQAARTRGQVPRSLALLRGEMDKVARHLSDNLIFIIRAKYTKNLPAKAQQVVAGKMSRLAKVYRDKMTFLHRLAEAPFVRQEPAIVRSLEDAILTIVFAVQTVPYEDLFASPVKRRMDAQVRNFHHYATLLHDISPFDPAALSFREGSTFHLHYIPPVPGKRLADVLALLEGMNDDQRIGAGVLRKFYDFLMVDVETWLLQVDVGDPDRDAVTALKKWLIFRQLSGRICCTLGSLRLLRDSLDDYRSKLEGAPFYLPAELVDLIREVCYVFAVLLQEERSVQPLYSGDDHVRLLKRRKTAHSWLLRRTEGALAAAAAPGRTECDVPGEMRALLAMFVQTCAEARRFEKAADMLRFEKLVRDELDRLGFHGPLLEGLQDQAVLDRLMQAPWVRTQSWNRQMVLAIVRICRAISFSLDPAITCQKLG